VSGAPGLRALVLGGVLLASAGLATLLHHEPAVVIEAAAGDGQASERAWIGPAFVAALERLRAGDAAGAEARFAAISARAPWLVEAHVNRGFALLGLERPRGAVDAFQQALALRPHQANAYYGLGVAHDLLGNRDDAVGAMRTFVHLAPPDSPHVRRARSAIWEWQDARDDTAR
jgi:Flp pilus assembly protein TadD